MSDTWSGSSSTSWFTAGNWNTGKVPTISATGTQSVVINGSSGDQPVIPATETEITVNQTVNSNGTAEYTSLTETQIGGESITLSNGADLTIQGDALGIFYGDPGTITAAGGTLSGLHGATSTIASYDSHMSVVAIGNDTLTVETINENFGLISIGNGNTLTIYNTYGNGANAQDFHGLINYGLITVAAGGDLNIASADTAGSTVANFYNAGWIDVDGGTLSISSSVLDGANTIAGSGTADGYIEIGAGGDAILAGSVASGEEVLFTDSASNTLQITAGTLFSGTVGNFGSGDTIIVNGFTSTSNVTIATVGGETELVTANGSMMTTITLAGSISSNFATGTTASGEEFITAGKGYTFSTTGTGAFETAANFIGDVAPGDTLSYLDIVTIKAGNASVSSAGVADGGLITVASGAAFVDTKSLSGTGMLAVGTGGTATLTGGASVSTIVDNGALVIAGNLSSAISGTGTVSIASGTNATLSGTDSVTTLADSGTLTITGRLTDSNSINGTGTLVVAAGGTASLAGNTTLGSINDYGTIVLGGTATTVNMEGASGSVVEFTKATNAVPLVSFGTGDEIILSPTALAALPAGDGYKLTYNNGTLVVSETTSSGHAVKGASDTILVTGGTTALAAASFEVLNAASGIAIELTSSIPSQNFDFSIASGTTGSFESGANFIGGVAPGDTLVSGETVTIGSGTASVSTTGVTDNGRITVASGAGFIDNDSLTGTGTLVVGPGATARLGGSVALGAILDSGTIDITGAGPVSAINMEGNNANSVADFTGTDVTGGTLNTAITNLGFGDTVVLGASAFTVTSGDALTETYNNGQITVTDLTKHTSVTVNLGVTTGDPTSWLKVSDTSGQLTITLCFYPGTALATPAGETKVEDIKAGDLLMTANGAKPVRWIGQSHIHTGFADPLRSLPIRIRQGALGAGLPMRDLLLSPDHAICIGGILVQASALVNGSSIIREYDVPEQFTYYHVELDSHELLLAEGVEAESFVDNVDRMHFHNWDDRVAPETAIAEMNLPRAKSMRQLPQAIRGRLGISLVAVA